MEARRSRHRVPTTPPLFPRTTSESEQNVIYAIKLLFAALIAGGIGAYLFRRAFDTLLSSEDYWRAWTSIALVTCATFLCKFPPLFCIAIAVIAVLRAGSMRSGVVGNISLFAMLAVVLPPIELKLGLGNVGYLLTLTHFRVLALALLVVPAMKLMLERSDHKRHGLFWIDAGLVGYQLLRIALAAPSSTGTSILRSLLEASLDTLLPYYVITRGVRTLPALRFIVTHLMIGIAFAASVGIIEILTQRNLYSGLQTIYDVTWQLTYVLSRGGFVRVQAAAQVPINFAILLMTGIGLLIWLRGDQWRRQSVFLLFAAMFVALVGTWSRGPWLAAGTMLLVVIVLGRMSASVFRVLLLLVLLLGMVAIATGADSAVVAALGALFGTTGSDLSTIDYRRQLLSTSLALIKQSPWLGVPNYASQLQSLRQGEGIVDIVNSYVAIMLGAGVTGLALYLLPFVIVVHRLLNAIRRDATGIREPGSRFAVSMVALVLALLFAIFTTSTFDLLPLLLTLSVALPAAWLAMPGKDRNSIDLTPYRGEPRGHVLGRFQPRPPAQPLP